MLAATCQLSIRRWTHRAPVLRPLYRKPKFPALQRKPVTVCIAAITLEGYIVTASDMMVASFVSSSDPVMIKFEEFHDDWIALMSADDLTQALPIIDRAKRNFYRRENSLGVARACFKHAYQSHLKEIAADKVLGRFGMDMRTFQKSGKRRFTESVFNSLSEEIRKVKVDCEFLVCGFDKNRQPHLFTVKEPGTDSVYDRPGFCAIGAGQYAAEGMLYYLGQITTRSLHETIFNVCAAKFMAEKVPGVGQETNVHVKKQGCDAFVMETWVIPTIKKQWQEQGQPRIPDGLLKQLQTAHIDFISTRK